MQTLLPTRTNQPNEKRKRRKATTHERNKLTQGTIWKNRQFLRRKAIAYHSNSE